MLWGCGPCRHGDAERIRISEVVTRNRTHLDEHGKTPDWIELSNESLEPRALDGFLTDDRANKRKWPVERRTLAPRERAIFFVRLRAAGSYLAWLSPEGRVREEILRLPPLGPDLSYGLWNGSLRVLRATPGAPNGEPIDGPTETYTATTAMPVSVARRDVKADLARAIVAVEPPDLTATDLRVGPSSRSFFAEDEIDCIFFSRVTRGARAKLWCAHATADGRYFERRGHIVDAARAVLGGLLVDEHGRSLLDSRGRFARPDRLKVKYYDGRPENLEVHTEIAASRILWALGFFTDAVYSVDELRCRGCVGDPFNERQREPVDGTTTFRRVAIERRLPGRDLGHWKWADALRVRDRERGALLIATAVLQQTSTSEAQHSIRCPRGAIEDGACTRPIMMITDPGASFGDRRDKVRRALGTRATLARYREARVFEPGGCTLAYSAVKGTQITLWEDARLEAVRRAAQLDREKLTAIVEAAGLAQASRDHPKDQSLARGKTEVELVALWVDAIRAKLDEVAAARCSDT